MWVATSPNKSADEVQLGAEEVIVSTDEAEIRKHAGSFDFILDAISADHELNAYLQPLKLDSTMMLIGAVEAGRGRILQPEHEAPSFG